MISVVGIPFDEFSSFLRGAAKAPEFIRAAYHSDSSNYYTESGLDLAANGEWNDKGDLILPEGAEAIEQIQHRLKEILAASKKLMALGGDHSVTYPIVKAIHHRYGPITIIHLDAHPDLYDHFDGNPYSHACPFARIMEEGLATRLVQVGIRTMNAHQKAQAQRFGVEVFEMKNWQQFYQLTFKGPVHLSLDIDVIDPAFAPGVSHHEPGGLTSREVISIIQHVQAQVVSADLVELNPSRDVSGITAMLAAKLYKELLDLLIRTS